MRRSEEGGVGSPARPVQLPHTRQLDVRARHGDTYRLLIAVPPGAAPSVGFPVVYMVDGNALFAGAVDAARLQAGRPDVTGVGPAILVGIGYPGDAPFDMERRSRDLLPDNGGADRFLAFISDEIMPLVATLAPVDAGRQSLIGHSFGGLFALHALFTRPGLFGALVAGSPSIWWNERAILTTETQFHEQPAATPLPRLLIAVGGDEQDAARAADPERAARLRMARMRDNAAEMATRLSGSGRVACEHVVFPGENHISVLPAMLARAIAFLLTERPASGGQPS